MNAYRSPLSRLRSTLGGSRSEASSAFGGAGAPASDGSGAPAAGRSLLAFAGATFAAVIASVALLVGSATPAAADEGCPNEARREEQGAAARALPDCRAYELVTQPYQPSPQYLRYYHGFAPTQVTNYFEREPEFMPTTQPSELFSLDGNSVTYAGWGPNSEGSGSGSNLSRRGSSGWFGENLMPPKSRNAFLCAGGGAAGGSANLDKIAISIGTADNGGYCDYNNGGHDEPPLVPGESEEAGNLFLRDTSTHAFSLVNPRQQPGSLAHDAWYDAMSADGSHVVLQSLSKLTPDAPFAEAPGFNPSLEYCNDEFGDVYVSDASGTHLLTVLPGGVPARGSLAGGHPVEFNTCHHTPPAQTAAFTHAVSADGERMLFNAGGGLQYDTPYYSAWPDAPYLNGGLYLREHPGAAQSDLAHGGALGIGNVSAGSNQVTSLEVTFATGFGRTIAGSDEVIAPEITAGEFEVGQTIEGEGIPAGTTITETGYRSRPDCCGGTETSYTLVLSNDVSESLGNAKIAAVSPGPAPFAVGQMVTGPGIPTGATITAVEPGGITLSKNVIAAGSEVRLESSSECTEAGKACTIQIDIPEEGASGSAGAGQFQWANPETTKILFTDVERLTPDSTAAAGKPDLYEYDLERPQGQRLRDLTVSGSEPADVLGLSGASDDGSYVYFAAHGVLASNQNSRGAEAEAGEANLYLWHGGTTTFIATLNENGGDRCDWTAYCLTARVSQNGKFIAFDSINSLTGYDNQPVRPIACQHLTALVFEGGTEELPCILAFRFAAESGEHGELTCATCSPNGPLASEFAWAVIPQATREFGGQGRGRSIVLSHPLSNSGQIFFETMEPLTPGDENETWDVYEYSGGEGPSAQLHLISSGKSELPSYFMDATSDGKNAFFVTFQPLVRSDTRPDYDLYDARVDGGFAEPLNPPCESESCRGEAQRPPAGSTPSSANFSGPEEGSRHPRCKSGFVLRHGKCVRKHRRHKHRQRHHRHHRRAGK